MLAPRMLECLRPVAEKVRNESTPARAEIRAELVPASQVSSFETVMLVTSAVIPEMSISAEADL